MTLVRNGHLEMASEVVGRIASEPIKNHLLRLSVLKAKKSVAAVVEDYVEVKNDLIREYGEEVDGGVQIDPRAPGFAEFNEKYNELATAEVEFSPVALSPRLLDMIELSADDLDILIHVGLVVDEDEVVETNGVQPLSE